MDYWAKRQAKIQEKLTDKKIAEVEAQLKKYYRQTMNKVIGQFIETYNELLLNIKEGNDLTPADLYNLDRYWKMQGQLKAQLEELGDVQSVLFSKQFEEEFKNIYQSTLVKKGQTAFTKIDKQQAKQLINEIWVADGKSWSQRVWNNTDKLQQALNDRLVECVIAGRKPTELKKVLMEQFDVSYRRADTIARTELAHVQTQASKQRYIDYGITEVEVLVSPDERTCPHCGALEGKRFSAFGTMPVPAHPNCRCCIVPVIPEE